MPGWVWNWFGKRLRRNHTRLPLPCLLMLAFPVEIQTDPLPDFDLRCSAPVKPKLCMAAIAGLALVNRSFGTEAAKPHHVLPAGVMFVLHRVRIFREQSCEYNERLNLNRSVFSNQSTAQPER